MISYSVYSTDGQWLAGGKAGDSHEDALVRAAEFHERRRAGRGQSALYHAGREYIVVREDPSGCHGMAKLVRLHTQPRTTYTAEVVSC